MKPDTYAYFKELRQHYYLAGRSLMTNQLFGMAFINFGYAIELSLKFLLVLNGTPKKELYNHNIKKYYEQTVAKGYMNALAVSEDFLIFMNERLNARYPIMISDHLESHRLESRAYIGRIDMLHCYDDFILQLDDAIIAATGDPRVSIGFRCCRGLETAKGRIFFHCNDHAFARISKYRKFLAENRDKIDNYKVLDTILDNPINLWNFQGLMAFRPWGPKTEWKPASNFVYPKYDEEKLELKAAKWEANNTGVEMYISSLEITLPPGTYDYRIGESIITKDSE